MKDSLCISIGQAALLLGISIVTLRRWDKSGIFKPDYITPGKHRRYCVLRLRAKFFGEENKEDIDFSERVAIAYSRVSSADQKCDLLRQQQILRNYCENKKIKFIELSDCGSGLNYHKKGLKSLLKKICRSEVSELVLTHKDRLLRFGSKLIFDLCGFFGARVTILNGDVAKSFEEELASDVIEIITIFSAKMYGRRSHRNKKLLEKTVDAIGK